MPRDLAEVLRTVPSRFRGQIARGLAAGVDRTADGDVVGVIRQAAVISVGEALGHELWIDSQFCQDVAAQINMAANGVKGRFSHPEESGDAIGTFLGRWAHATFDGSVVRADLYLSRSATVSPDGNLAEYVLTLAETDPAAFGASIVFEHDQQAEADFYASHQFQGRFMSPDSANGDQYPHARIARLAAVDVVDEPAANPQGLFHRGKVIPAADALFDYALGRGPRPTANAFSIDPDRLRGFLQRALSSRKLQIVPEGNAPMDLNTATDLANAGETAAAESTTPPADQAEATTVETSTTEATAEEAVETTEETTAEAESTPTEGAALSQRTAREYFARWGDRGAVWFAKGLTWQQAEAAELTELRSELAAANARIKALETQAQHRRGAPAPVSASLPPEKGVGRKFDAQGQPLKGLDLAAAAIRLPGKKYDD